MSTPNTQAKKAKASKKFAQVTPSKSITHLPGEKTGITPGRAKIPPPPGWDPARWSPPWMKEEYMPTGHQSVDETPTFKDQGRVVDVSTPLQPKRKPGADGHHGVDEIPISKSHGRFVDETPTPKNQGRFVEVTTPLQPTREPAAAGGEKSTVHKGSADIVDLTNPGDKAAGDIKPVASSTPRRTVTRTPKSTEKHKTDDPVGSVEIPHVKKESIFAKGESRTGANIEAFVEGVVRDDDAVRTPSKAPVETRSRKTPKTQPKHGANVEQPSSSKKKGEPAPSPEADESPLARVSRNTGRTRK